MKPIFALLGTAALLSAAAGAQSMMEHAAAAAGAVAGTAGGKTLSNGIDKILGQAADTASDAAKAPTNKPPANKPPANDSAAKPSAMNAKPAAAPGPDMPALSGAGALRSHPAAKQRRDRPVFASPALQRGESQRVFFSTLEPVPLPPKPEDFEKVTEGESRDDVISALGVPSSHVTIPDDGHLIEIMSWLDGQRRVGTVRTDNGKVVSRSF